MDDSLILGLIFAYGYGCACIVVGFVMWAYAQAQEN